MPPFFFFLSDNGRGSLVVFFFLVCCQRCSFVPSHTRRLSRIAGARHPIRTRPNRRRRQRLSAPRSFSGRPLRSSSAGYEGTRPRCPRSESYIVLPLYKAEGLMKSPRNQHAIPDEKREFRPVFRAWLYTNRRREYLDAVETFNPHLTSIPFTRTSCIPVQKQRVSWKRSCP